ncbi:hypothetical protein ACQKNT_27290 [Bacillus cereus]|uniref:hypothetical protein n=1 Tax=Bacillus cereus group TaxID=86661 RepID=UPI000279BBD7|nr:hypothetical protein [Bacillus cereus]EJR82311.1 hypothetical protein IKA_05443 [Bacillus cereus VD169]
MKKIDFRYLNTYVNWCWYQASEEFVKKWTVLLFLIVGILAIFSYYFTLLGNQSGFLVCISKFVANLLGIKHIHDEIVKTVITTVIGSLTIVTSLLSAIYVFTHREQKSVSPSASTDNHKNLMVTAVICLMIFNIIFGYLTINEYTRLLNESGYEPSLVITKNLMSKITLLCLTHGLLLYLVVNFIKYLYKTMSVDSMLEDSVKQAQKSLDDVLYTYRVEEQDKPEESEETEKPEEQNKRKESRKIRGFEELLIERYRRLHFSFESVFQNLKFAAEHNMNKEFEENISEFKSEVLDKIRGECDKYNDIKDIHHYLLTKDKKEFIDLYNSALRSNLALVSNLIKNQRYNKAKEVVSLYFYMYISNNPTLSKIFKISLNDFLDFIDTNDERQLLILLDGINEIPKLEALVIYKFLLMKMVNKNQLKNLTNVVYSFKNENEQEPFTKNSVIVILLQNLIKSIEISNYQITGFLVKFLITNFLGEDLAKGLMILKKKRDSFSSVLEEGEIIEGISENGVSTIKINDETFDYCFKKALILLYGQHLYSIDQKMWFTINRNETGKEIELSKEFKNCPYSEYIMKKTKTASSKHGLLFFEDKPIMAKIHDELNLNHLITEKEMQASS